MDIFGIEESILNGLNKAFAVLRQELLVPKFGGHRNESDHVTTGGQGKVVLSKVFVLKCVKKNFKATFVAKLIHQVQESLREACLYPGACKDTLKSVHGLDHIV